MKPVNRLIHHVASRLSQDKLDSASECVTVSFQHSAADSSLQIVPFSVETACQTRSRDANLVTHSRTFCN